MDQIPRNSARTARPNHGSRGAGRWTTVDMTGCWDWVLGRSAGLDVFGGRLGQLDGYDLMMNNQTTVQGVRGTTATDACCSLPRLNVGEYVGAKNRAVHMICIFPSLPYSLPMFDLGRSACIDDRGPAHFWKSKSISLILGKFVAAILSICLWAVVTAQSSLVTRQSSVVPVEIVSRRQIRDPEKGLLTFSPSLSHYHMAVHAVWDFLVAGQGGMGKRCLPTDQVGWDNNNNDEWGEKPRILCAISTIINVHVDHSDQPDGGKRKKGKGKSKKPIASMSKGSNRG